MPTSSEVLLLISICPQGGTTYRKPDIIVIMDFISRLNIWRFAKYLGAVQRVREYHAAPYSNDTLLAILELVHTLHLFWGNYISEDSLFTILYKYASLRFVPCLIIIARHANMCNYRLRIWQNVGRLTLLWLRSWNAAFQQKLPVRWVCKSENGSRQILFRTTSEIETTRYS